MLGDLAVNAAGGEARKRVAGDCLPDARALKREDLDARCGRQSLGQELREDLAGALIGSASGEPGSGAAIGAGTGLLIGSAAGSDGMYGSSYQMQRSYDIAYMQCMYAKGNQLPGQFVSQHTAAASHAPAYPPPGTPPPVGVMR